MIEALNLGLAALVLGLAVWAVAARDAFAAVAGFVAYGLLLTLVWVQLHGIDVALTEAAIGGGLTGALLIGAAARLRVSEAAARAECPRAFPRSLAAVLAAGVAAALAVCVLALPDPAPTLAHLTAANMGATGVGNPITAVLASISRDGHAARGDRAAVRARRRVVARAGPRLGRPARAAARGRPQRHPRLHRAGAAADRHRRGDVHFLGGCRPSGRQVPGRDDHGRDVAAGRDGGTRRHAADQPDVVEDRTGDRTAGVHRHRTRGRGDGGRVSRLPGRVRQALDRRHRAGTDAFAGTDAGAHSGRRAATGAHAQ